MATAQLTPVGVGIQNVLIATDFSRYSNAALNFGLQVAKAYSAQAHVVFVIPSDQFLLAGPEAFVAAKDAARRDLEQLQAELHRSHSQVRGRGLSPLSAGRRRRAVHPGFRPAEAD
jgi:nucleotide-binding universal stress UspA family protein